jgi:hypothetical protein
MINAPSEVEAAVQKAIAGQPMSANEKRTVQGMMDWLDMIDRAGDGANEELGAIEREGVYDFSEQAQDDVSLGSEIDFDALPQQDEQAALRALGFNEEESNELTGREQGAAGRVRSAADEVSEANAGQVVEGRQGGLEGQVAGREAQEGFNLAGQTNAEAARAEQERLRLAAEEAKAAEEPKGPNVTADQVDMFNTQDSLFTNNRESAPKPATPSAAQSTEAVGRAQSGRAAGSRHAPQARQTRRFCKQRLQGGAATPA